MSQGTPITQKKSSLFEILEYKSAKTEGILASLILSLAQAEQLSVSSRMFFAAKSPSEAFLRDTLEFKAKISSDLEYIVERARLLSICRRIYSEKNANEIESIKWLLKFQLYGFFEACFREEKYLLGLIALREAELLSRWQVRKKLQTVSERSEKAKNAISEFIDL